MPTVALNGRVADGFTCPADKPEVIYWSDELAGFGLRCRRGGARRWFVQYRTKTGETRKHVLGDPATVGFAQARREAAKLLAAAKLGGDPAGDVRAARAAVTFGDLADRFLIHQQARLRPRSFVEATRHLKTHAKPLHGKRADGIGQRDVVALLQSVTVRGPILANRVRSSISAAYSWGMKAALVASNPVVATFKPSEERARDRVLSDNELRLIWRCTAGDADYDRIVRLLMLTGKRRDEIGGLMWPEITVLGNGSARCVLPPERSKNRRPHELMLPPMIAELLPLPREDTDGSPRELVFGAARGPFAAWSTCKARLDARITQLNDGTPIAPWVLHDLRRTFVTRLNDLGVEPHVIEALVNHIGGVAKAGIAGVYNRSAYGPQKAAALELWCSHISKIFAEG